MITFILGLILGFALAAIPAVYGDTQDHAAPASAIGPNVESEVIPAAVPSLIRIYDGDALRHEWTADPNGLIGWTRNPELLIFLTYTAEGRTIVAGDPSDGALYEIAPVPAGWFGYAEQPDTLIIHTPDGDSPIMLPGELVQPVQADGYPHAAGAFRVAADGVRRSGQLLLENRGLEHLLLDSPSSPWVAAIERQPLNTYAIWSIDASGGNPSFERLVDYAELPLDRAEGNPLSPNSRWFVTTGTVQTTLRRADGLVKILPIGSFGQPLWRSDSAAFLLRSTIGQVIVDLPKAALRVSIHGSPPILSWENNRISWLAATVGSDE